jgi:hypothetical protein
MAKAIEKTCPGCGEKKPFRADQKYCSKDCVKRMEPELTEKSEVIGNDWILVLPKTRVHTLEQLIEACEIDTSIWNVERFICNKWDMAAIPRAITDGTKDEKGKNVWSRESTIPIITELYQVKAFLKKKVNVIAAKSEIAELMKLSKEKAPNPKPVKKPEKIQGGMLEINLIDHHFGKQAWGIETRGANYDVKIAAQVFNRALDTIIDRSPFSTYDEVWFVVGNDLFNADNQEGTTTAGTPVETDFRHEKTYVTVRTLLVQAIEHKLRHIANKVKVIVVPGNHDRNATWHLGDSLELYFSKYEDVIVDNQPGPRKYHRYGNTLIGYAHGDKTKQKSLPLLMTVEARELFGETKFHEWHTGHTHQSKTEEFNGIRVRVLPALCPPDAWHAEMGFVGNLRSSEAFVWDPIQGLIGIVIYTDSDSLIEKASVFPTEVAR